MKLDREREGDSGALGESEREELARLREQKAAWEKERAELEMERDGAQAISGPVGEGLDEPVIVAEFIASCRTRYGIPHAIACRALEVSQSWFYKWINREPTARRQRRARLDEEIKKLFTASGGTYGSPRITGDLRDAGWKVSANTVAARMAELGLVGRPPKKRRSLTRQGRRPAAPELVRRNFSAVDPDVLWCGDVTQIDAAEGPLFLATVEDRRMLGHAVSAHHDAALVGASLRTAASGQRRAGRWGHLPHRPRQRGLVGVRWP